MLSDVEHVERVRNLPLRQQVIYRVATVGMLIMMLLAALLVAIVIALVGNAVFFNEAISVANGIIIGMPAGLALLMTLGLSNNPIIPGLRLAVAARQAARRGLVTGFVSGALFGMLWYFIFRQGAVYYEAWDYLFHPSLLLRGLVFGLAVGPAFALFKAVGTVLGDVVLHYLSVQARQIR